MDAITKLKRKVWNCYINKRMLKTYWKKKIYFPVFQWELNHIAMLTETASSSWETAEPMEKE